MARIAGVDLPRNKRIIVALTYIYGVGKSVSELILKKAGIDASVRTDVLTEGQIAKIREVMDSSYKVEGELRKNVAMNIRRLIDLNCYRGSRHRKGLPVRGQRTHSNARTRKGPAKPIAGKKSIKAMKG